MTQEEFEQAAQYWNRKEQTAMLKEALQQAMEDYINANNTCALDLRKRDIVAGRRIYFKLAPNKIVA